MIGNLSYEEIENLITIMASSSENIRSVLNSYQDNNNISSRTEKMLHFCSDIDKYIANLKDNILLNKDADIVIERTSVYILKFFYTYFLILQVGK